MIARNQSLTNSELLFTNFLEKNSISFERVPQETIRTPDLIVDLSTIRFAVEIKEVATLEDRSHLPNVVYTKTIGDKVRGAIREASAQLRWADDRGLPTMLLIFDASSPFDHFHLEDLDFTTAMYGEFTKTIDRETLKESPIFNGKNELLTPNSKTHISALARLTSASDMAFVTVFPNIFAKRPLQPSDMPKCFDFRKIELT